MVVVLPAPFSPIRLKIDPWGTESESPSTAVCFPKRLVNRSMPIATPACACNLVHDVPPSSGQAAT